MKNMLMVMLVAGLVVGGAGTSQVNAQEATLYFVEADAPWVGTNWSLQGCNGDATEFEPTIDDVAVICSGNTATLDQGRGCLRTIVQSGATVIIDDVAILTLSGADQTSTIDGTIELTGGLLVSPAPLTADHTFVGSGEIVGKANSANILLEATTNRGLISSITIRGALEIGNYNGSAAMFTTAGGVIHADTNGTIKLSTHGVDDDDLASATLYKVSHASAILEFAQFCEGAACPANCFSKANFEVIEGKLIVDNGNGATGLHTNGTLTAEPGAVIEILTGEAVFSRLADCSP